MSSAFLRALPFSFLHPQRTRQPPWIQGRRRGRLLRPSDFASPSSTTSSPDPVSTSSVAVTGAQRRVCADDTLTDAVLAPVHMFTVGGLSVPMPLPAPTSICRDLHRRRPKLNDFGTNRILHHNWRPDFSQELAVSRPSPAFRMSNTLGLKQRWKQSRAFEQSRETCFCWRPNMLRVAKAGKLPHSRPATKGRVLNTTITIGTYGAPPVTPCARDPWNPPDAYIFAGPIFNDYQFRRLLTS
ncbi:hypothetical protein HPP92_018478 [Vanilla planifolia]|uniref:Uncharacterized protein n=1 Tax=Vanilla planifolia TaxID=51239 RepID=A0A835UQ06_VANPL|nr:hypothetical protein HPP92_019096 [Vanilla planifolia]KAG0469150.1 hypothetical protein HPP92_018478 [Vanilla planifolia]